MKGEYNDEGDIVWGGHTEREIISEGEYIMGDHLDPEQLSLTQSNLT